MVFKKSFDNWLELFCVHRPACFSRSCCNDSFRESVDIDGLGLYLFDEFVSVVLAGERCTVACLSRVRGCGRGRITFCGNLGLNEKSVDEES